MASNVCTVCESDKVDGVNQALADGVSVRLVAERFGFTRTTIGHHRAHCLPRLALRRAALERIGRRENLQSSTELTHELQSLKDVIGAYLEAAVREGKSLPLAILRELRATQELLLKSVLVMEGREAEEAELGPFLRRLQAVEDELGRLEGGNAAGA